MVWLKFEEKQSQIRIELWKSYASLQPFHTKLDNIFFLKRNSGMILKIEDHIQQPRPISHIFGQVFGKDKDTRWDTYLHLICILSESISSYLDPKIKMCILKIYRFTI